MAPGYYAKSTARSPKGMYCSILTYRTAHSALSPSGWQPSLCSACLPLHDPSFKVHRSQKHNSAANASLAEQVCFENAHAGGVENKEKN